jgi:hypothetical protein
MWIVPGFRLYRPMSARSPGPSAMTSARSSPIICATTPVGQAQSRAGFAQTNTTYLTFCRHVVHVLCQDCSWITGRVEKRSQLIENTLKPESFFMKLRRPEGVGDKPEAIHLAV